MEKKMITVCFDLGNGMFHHVGGDYDSADDAISYASKAVEMSPRYKQAIVKENGEIVEVIEK
jgi:hypothetical protein